MKGLCHKRKDSFTKELMVIKPVSISNTSCCTSGGPLLLLQSFSDTLDDSSSSLSKPLILNKMNVKPCIKPATAPIK